MLRFMRVGNLSVGMPLDLAVIEAGTHAVTSQRRIEAADEGFARMSHAWSDALRDAFQKIDSV